MADYIKTKEKNKTTTRSVQSKFMLLRAMMSNLLLLLMQNKINNSEDGGKNTGFEIELVMGDTRRNV